jgi:hypothetical protein
MIRKTCDTYSVRIYIAGDYARAVELCREFCDEGLCVTVTKTDYIYTRGMESGIVVGLVNYPRFEVLNTSVIDHTAERLANHLMEGLYQWSVLIDGPGYTTWLSCRPDDQPEEIPFAD